MPRVTSFGAWQRVGAVAAVIVVIGALYLGQSILVPFALATLVAFLLAPVVRGLERLHIRRVPAVVVTVVLASSGVAALGWMVYGQLDQLADSLPAYRDNIREKLESLRGKGPLGRIEEGLADQLPPDTSTPAPTEAPAPGPTSPAAPTGEDRLGRPTGLPVPVRLVPAGRPPALQFLGELLGPLLAPISSIGVIFVLVLFMLVYQEDLRNRLLRLANRRQLLRTTQALSDVSERISTYLLMTLIVNATYGIPVGLGLWILGVPNALLWGLFAVLLRFIPYIGPWIAAGFPILLSVAISPGWSLTAWVVGLFLVLELVSNNLVEPKLYGKKTGLSPMAVVVAAVFWTWLWGTTGLFLSIPLTLVLAVVGSYVPQLKFLSILLRDEPGLGPSERFYQRLIAGDSDEAVTVAEAFLKDHGAAELYDHVVIPALRAAKHDALDGRLDADTLRFVRESTRTLVDEVADRQADAASTPEPPDPADPKGLAGIDAAGVREPAPAMRLRGVRAAFVCAGDETDALAGLMLADVLRADGMELRMLPDTALIGELLDAIRREAPAVVCVGGIHPYAALRTRHLCKRLRTEASGVRIVLAVWDAKADPAWTEDRMLVARADRVASSIATAAEALRALATETVDAPAVVVEPP